MIDEMSNFDQYLTKTLFTSASLVFGLLQGPYLLQGEQPKQKEKAFRVAVIIRKRDQERLSFLILHP